MNIKNKMNIKKLTVSAFAAVANATLPAAVPEVSNVTMAQDATRLVTITYTLADAPAVVTVDVQTNNANGTWMSIGGEAICNAMGDVWKEVGGDLAESQTFSGTITWHPDHSWPDHKIAEGSARAVVTAWALENTPDYMVVDLAAAQTVSYYPAVDFLPGSVPGQTGAITNNPVYKTSQLVMRKIMARGVTWTMGSADGETQRTAARETPHRVTLANNYYIGVFEVTQAQWKNILPSSTLVANFTAEGDMRPMETVNFSDVSNSFLPSLDTKTGLDFTLPSDAQWEFAARAGHGSGYWNNGTTVLNTNSDDNLNYLGRYKNNNNGGGTAIVGTYAPSDWGLYDMHGNVKEWCLDFFKESVMASDGAVNESGSNHVTRGGSWTDDAGVCRSAYRGQYQNNRHNSLGFRVLCTVGLQ